MASLAPPTVTVAVCKVATVAGLPVTVVTAEGIEVGADEGLPAGAAAPADGVEFEPPVAAMATPPPTAATDSPTMAIMMRGFFIVPHFRLDLTCCFSGSGEGREGAASSAPACHSPSAKWSGGAPTRHRAQEDDPPR